MAHKRNMSHIHKHGQDRTCSNAAAQSLKQAARRLTKKYIMLSILQLVSLVRPWLMELLTAWQVQASNMSYTTWNGVNYTSLLSSHEILYILLLHCCISLHICVTKQDLGVSSSCQGYGDDEI